MNKHSIIRQADDGRDNVSLWDRCRMIVENGIKKYGDAGGLPISGTGRARKKKKKVEGRAKKASVAPPTKHDEPRKKPRNKSNI